MAFSKVQVTESDTEVPESAELNLEYDRNGVRVYWGRAEKVYTVIDPRNNALLLTDPPYGVDEKTNRGERQRTALAKAKNFASVMNDDKPFDPSYLLEFNRIILFGANYFAEKLPRSPSWLIWDKLNGLNSKREVGFNDNADVEMAWSNLGGPARIIPCRWMGIMKETEQREARVHPTQKPIILMQRIIEYFGKTNELIVDPYAGSGSTGIGALRAGHPAVLIEAVYDYVETIIRRLEAEDI